MSNYRDFTSLPPDKEQQFIVFEKTSVEAAGLAKKLGMIVAGIFGVVVIVVVLSFDKPKNKMADDDMGMLKKSSTENKTSADKQPAATPDRPATPSADDSDDADHGDDADDADGDADGDDDEE